jgi:uncharacterized protein (TIGR02996 family)
VDDLLRAIVAEPQAQDRWLVLADYLEEHDDPRRAELLRLHRGLLATCCEPDRHPERAVWQARMVDLIGLGVRPCVPQRTVVLGKGVEMVFNFIPPGTFLMGSPPQEEKRGEDEVQHRVTLTQGFYLGMHPVTQAQWQALMGNNPSHCQGDTLLVEKVLWDECQEFVEKLSQRADNRFRLPTEAEWEYACRAGTTSLFSFGETLSTEQANYNGNFTYGKGHQGLFRKKTTPVGSFPGNAWGLMDMHGNVWEWCQDWYGDYPAGERTDPSGARSGTARVLRGGSWLKLPGGSRSACRNRVEPGHRSVNAGCRILLCLDGQGP